MICFTAISISKLIKRFSFIVLTIYATQVLNSVAVEKELEEQEENIEYSETNRSTVIRSVNSDAAQETNSKRFFAFCETIPSISRGFIVSASHKLYLLFSQWITDRWFVQC